MVMKNWEPLVSLPALAMLRRPGRVCCETVRPAGGGYNNGGVQDYLELEVLIGELRAIDGLAAGAVAIGEVATLDHEILDDAVEARPFIAISLLTSRQSAFFFGTRQSQRILGGKKDAIIGLPEVFGSFRNSLAVEADHDAPEIFVAMLDVEKNLQ